jgi:hypothetical protein
MAIISLGELSSPIVHRWRLTILLFAPLQFFLQRRLKVAAQWIQVDDMAGDGGHGSSVADDEL